VPNREPDPAADKSANKQAYIKSAQYEQAARACDLKIKQGYKFRAVLIPMTATEINSSTFDLSLITQARQVIRRLARSKTNRIIWPHVVFMDDLPYINKQLSATDSVLYVVAHGFPGAIYVTNDSDSSDISPKQLRDLFVEHSLTTAISHIKLFNCNSGSPAGSKKRSFADSFWLKMHSTEKYNNLSVSGYLGYIGEHETKNPKHSFATAVTIEGKMDARLTRASQARVTIAPDGQYIFDPTFNKLYNFPKNKGVGLFMQAREKDSKSVKFGHEEEFPPKIEDITINDKKSKNKRSLKPKNF
jgi:hypothetical protein